MQFIDEITVIVKAGDGGDGAIAFRRERFRPRGGPSGGDGGKGGDIILRADSNLGTLIDLKYKNRLESKRGQNGGGKDRHGRGSESLIVRVPVGTAVHDADTGEFIGDLVEDGQDLVVAAGGKGGLGNMHFTTSSNQAPRKALPGEPGEVRTVRLELMLLADVGLVGMPSVGKSSLIARFSAARPRIAEYPFTTLVPNLGVVELGEGSSFVMADIPGLVRGASRGTGLGFRFLKHVQRTAILLHILAIDPAGENDLLDDFDALVNELHEFNPEMAKRPALVALNKCDLQETRDAETPLRDALKERGLELHLCSAATGEGLGDLRAAIVRKLNEREDG